MQRVVTAAGALSLAASGPSDSGRRAIDLCVSSPYALIIVTIRTHTAVVRSPGSAAQFRIGTSGFHYRHWKTIFYPPEMASKDWFAYYARHFDTVELNNTFYRLPPEGSFDLWRQGAPDGFCFAVKFSRYGTHMLKLKNPAEPIERLLTRAKRLKEHLGPLLVQLPPKWDINVPRLAEFLEATPPGQRWAIEFRDSRWLTQETYAVLRAHHAALCIHDMIPDHPHEITADWVYIRFHGGRYDGNYSDDALTLSASEIIGYLKSGLDVYAYFNNDLHGHALQNAATLKRLVLGRREEHKADFSKPAV